MVGKITRAFKLLPAPLSSTTSTLPQAKPRTIIKSVMDVDHIALYFTCY
jgi:hypothetical protein